MTDPGGITIEAVSRQALGEGITTSMRTYQRGFLNLSGEGGLNAQTKKLHTPASAIASRGPVIYNHFLKDEQAKAATEVKALAKDLFPDPSIPPNPKYSRSFRKTLFEEGEFSKTPLEVDELVERIIAIALDPPNTDPSLFLLATGLDAIKDERSTRDLEQLGNLTGAIEKQKEILNSKEKAMDGSLVKFAKDLFHARAVIKMHTELNNDEPSLSDSEKEALEARLVNLIDSNRERESEREQAGKLIEGDRDFISRQRKWIRQAGTRDYYLAYQSELREILSDMEMLLNLSNGAEEFAQRVFEPSLAKFVERINEIRRAGERGEIPKFEGNYFSLKNKKLRIGEIITNLKRAA